MVIFNCIYNLINITSNNNLNIFLGGFSVSYHTGGTLRFLTIGNDFTQTCDSLLKTVTFSYGRRANFISIDGTAYLVILFIIFLIIIIFLLL